MDAAQDVNGAAPKAEMVKLERSALTAFEPANLRELRELSTYLVASGLLPKAITKPEAAMAIIMAGRELGLTAMQALRSIHIIEGKPTLSGDLIAALVRKSKVCKYFRLVESSTTVAKYETWREGDPEPTPLAFTIEQAQRANLTGKDNWKKYPEAMLRARCIAALARIVYPELLMGIYEEDELDAPQTPRYPREAQVVDVEFAPAPKAVEELTLEEQRETIVKKFEGAESLEELKTIREEVLRTNSRDLVNLLKLSAPYKAAEKKLEEAAKAAKTKEESQP